MSAGRLALISLALVVLSGLPILLWLAPALALPDGTPMLDKRIGGYDLAEALAYLSGLGDRARGLYLGAERIADTAFPIGLFGLLASLPRLSFGPRLSAAALFVAAVYLGLDLMENAAVAGLLRADPSDITAESVARASLLTQAKFAAFFLAAALAALALVMRARLWFKRGP